MMVAMAAKSGDTVRVHYHGTLTDGTIFDSSREREPLEFVLGSGMVIPGFDAAVDGLEPGGKITRTIPAAEAYGEPDPRRMMQMPASQVPPGAKFAIGDMVQLQDDQGHVIPARISSMNDEVIELDMNHPLAGEDLTFELELVEIVA